MILEIFTKVQTVFTTIMLNALHAINNVKFVMLEKVFPSTSRTNVLSRHNIM